MAAERGALILGGILRWAFDVDKIIRASVVLSSSSSSVVRVFVKTRAVLDVQPGSAPSPAADGLLY